MPYLHRIRFHRHNDKIFLEYISQYKHSLDFLVLLHVHFFNSEKTMLVKEIKKSINRNINTFLIRKGELSTLGLIVLKKFCLRSRFNELSVTL